MKMRSFIFSTLLLCVACSLVVGHAFSAEKSMFVADNQEYVGNYTMTGLPFEKVIVRIKTENSTTWRASTKAILWK